MRTLDDCNGKLWGIEVCESTVIVLTGSADIHVIPFGVAISMDSRHGRVRVFLDADNRVYRITVD